MTRSTLIAVAAVLAACGSAPPAMRDDRGVLDDRIPPEIARVPDAEPRIEPIPLGGANKPYTVLGRSYVPIREDTAFTERGLGSWYGNKFHGRRTANGELYDMNAMTAAHPTLPLPSYVRVTNPRNGREVVVRVNDRGPFAKDRVIDLSYVAAVKLGVARGVAPVEVTRLTFEQIRTGSWRRSPAPEGEGLAVAAAPAAVTALAGPTSPTSPLAEAPPPVVVDTPVTMAVATTTASVTPTAAPAVTPQELTTSTKPAAPSPGFWVQLGAFREPAGAEAFHRRVIADLEWLGPLLVVMNDTGLYRLQAGPYASRDEALAASKRMRESLRLVPIVVERR